MIGFPSLERVVLISLSLASVARSQALHTDKHLGFQFKPPKDYKSIAIDPLERRAVAKYQAPTAEGSGDMGGVSSYRVFELKFYPRGRELTEADAAVLDDEDAPKSLTEQMRGYLDQLYSDYELTDERQLSIAGVKASELRYTNKEKPFSSYCLLVEQDEGMFLFEGTALTQRFKDAAAEFSKSAKTFKRIEKEDRGARDSELAQLKEQDRFLQQQIDKLPPGWSSLRTTRYLFLYDAEENFVKQLAERIEAIRDEYERLYPPDHPIEDVSIVRVCNSLDEYRAYGGPAGTGGYWYDKARELVFFDYRPRDVPLLVCNHEAFHQYIFYFYGKLAPHSWYNEGHGDYFAGAKMTKSNRISGYGEAPGGFSRLPEIKEGCRLLTAGKGAKDGAAVPLKEIMGYHQSDYYGGKGYDTGLCYAEGWAIVYMLREAKGLDERWKRILPDYLKNLLAARHQIATELMEKQVAKYEKDKKAFSSGDEDAPTEMPKEPSRDPKDYYEEASDRKETDVQDLAHKTTFADWTDGDWQKFQDFFLDYVKKL
jgi:hypothetical protein